MCGIAGYIDFENKLDLQLIKTMVKSIEHRGPDAFGYEQVGEHVLLGHTRLSILDLSNLAHQPMLSQDAKVILSYNGEIYNYKTLRSDLANYGFLFKSQSDTEVLLNSYLHYGHNLLTKISGMFAFAVWDEHKQKLLLARDPAGIKPLYYYPLPKGIIFASEIKAILSVLQEKRRVNKQGLAEYLWYGNTISENSLFKGIYKLLPGHLLEFSPAQGIQIKPYRKISEISPSKDSFSTAAFKVRDKLERAVISHLQSDVPVGVLLSGGVDSTALTAFASRHYPAKLKTFSVGFDYESIANELSVAAKTAQQFSTEHHEFTIKANDISATLERLVFCHDEPFADPANIPLYLLSAHLTGQVKVVLQGDGGDELFGGYRRYQILANKNLWVMLTHFASLSASLISNTAKRERLLRFCQAILQNNDAMRMAMLLTRDGQDYSPLSLLSPSMLAQLQVNNPFEQYIKFDREFSDLDSLQKMLYTDYSILLPHTFLEKVDKPSMAHGLEVRVPFLDDELMQYALSLPSHYKASGRQKKRVLRCALRGIVADSILDAPKRGFDVPINHWLRGSLSDYLRQVLLDSDFLDSGIVDMKILEKTIDAHISGQNNFGFILWKYLNLALWKKAYQVDFTA